MADGRRDATARETACVTPEGLVEALFIVVTTVCSDLGMLEMRTSQGDALFWKNAQYLFKKYVLLTFRERKGEGWR